MFSRLFISLSISLSLSLSLSLCLSPSPLSPSLSPWPLATASGWGVQWSSVLNDRGRVLMCAGRGSSQELIYGPGLDPTWVDRKMFVRVCVFWRKLKLLRAAESCRHRPHCWTPGTYKPLLLCCCWVQSTDNHAKWVWYYKTGGNYKIATVGSPGDAVMKREWLKKSFVTL